MTTLTSFARLGLRLLAVTTLSLAACSSDDSDSPPAGDGSAGAAGTSAGQSGGGQAGAGQAGDAGQGGAGTAGAGQSGGGQSNAGTGGNQSEGGQSGSSQSGSNQGESGMSGAGQSGSSGQGGAGNGGSGAGGGGTGGAADKCEALHPGVGKGGAGGGSTSLPKTTQRCYASTSDDGCRPGTSDNLEKDLSDPLTGCGFQVLSIQGDADIYADACDTLADCCEDTSNPTGCTATVAAGDQAKCVSFLLASPAVCAAPTASNPPAGTPIACCYETCSTIVCP